MTVYPNLVRVFPKKRSNPLIQSLCVLVLLISLFGTQPAKPVRADGPWYVDHDLGSDSNPGTEVAPFATIQKAIDEAVSGDIIYVAAGTYVENPTIAKSVTLVGAQPDVAVGGRTAAGPAESTIQGLVTVNASDVTINGFTLTRPGGTYALYVMANTPGNSNINFMYNIVDTVGSATMTSNVHAIHLNRGPDSVTIAHNLFNNIQADTKSASVIGVLDSASTDTSTDLLIQDNTFTNITSGTKGAYGIIINNAAGAPGAQILDNDFSGLNGGWTHAIGLEGPTPNAVVTGNTFTNLTAGGVDNVAIFFEANPNGGTVDVSMNAFNGSGYYGVAVHPDDLPGGSNGYNYTVDADMNYWGATTGPGTTTEVGPSVSYVPWWTDAAMTTLYGPVHNLTQDTWHLTIQAAIDAATDGDTIYINEGTYDETLNIDTRSDLTLVGADPATTIVKSSTTLPWNVGTYGTSRQTVLRVVDSTGIAVSNLTFDLYLVKGNLIFAGLYSDSTGSVEGNIFKNNQMPDTSGGYYELGLALRAPGYTDGDRAAITVNDNTFQDLGRVALHIGNYVEATITGNTFYKTEDDFGYGIELGTESTGVISGNTFYGFDTPAASDGSNSAAIYVENCFTGDQVVALTKNVILSNNEIYGNQWGIYIGNEFSGYAGNVDIVLALTDNTIYDNTDGGILIADEDMAAGSSVSVTGSGNTLTNNGDYGYYITTGGDGDITVDLTGETITGHDTGVYVVDTGDPSTSSYDVSIDDSDLSGNTTYGINNTVSGLTVDGSPNWWGTAYKPTIASQISGTVTFEPYWVNAAMTILSEPAPDVVYVDSAYTDGAAGGHIYGYDAFATIQEGITAVADGGAVNVAAGTYSEGSLVIDKALTLRGDGPTSTIVTAASTPVFQVTANTVTIEYLGITHPTQLTEGILVSAASDLTVDHVAFTNLANGTTNAYGIRFLNSFSNLTVKNSSFTGTDVAAYERVLGIYLPKPYTAENFLIEDSVFSKVFTGVDLRAHVNGLTIQRNTFGPMDLADCRSAASGIYMGDGPDGFDIDNVIIADNIFTSYCRGVYVWDYADNGNIGSFAITGNTFTDSIYSSGVRLMADWTTTATVATLLEGPIDIEDNTFTQSDPIINGQGVSMMDVRITRESATSQLNITGNEMTFIGPFSVSTYGMIFRGPITNITINDNTLDGGDAGGTYAGMPPTSGIYIRSNDAYWGAVPTSAMVDITDNIITGFVNGVSVYDTVAAVYGGLPAGAGLGLHDNTIAGNTDGIVSGAGEITDAARNWWGAASGPLDDKTLPNTPNYNNPSGEGDAVTPYVEYSPWCVDEDCTKFAQPEYTLTIISEHGTVAKDPDQPTYHYSDVVTLTAAPVTGWHFVNWSGDLSGSDNPATLPMVGDKSVTATFAINTYTLIYIAGNNGSLSGSASQMVNHGEDGTPVEAVPDTNYHFVAWSDGSTDNPRTDTNVTADVAVTASFAIDTFTLDYAAGTGGSLTGDTAQVVDYGTDGTPVTADPDTGYHFVAWSDGSTDNPRTDTNVIADVAVTATFAIDTFTLDYAAGTGGSLTGETSQTVDYGTDGTPVTAAANTGYHFVAWSDGSTDNPRTDTNVTVDVAVTASFAIDTFTLDYAAGTGGSLTGETAQVVNYGEDGTTVTATANTGYHFVAWSDGSTDNPRTDTNVIADVAVTANFAIDTFTLDYAAGTGGSLTGDTAQVVDYGTDGTPVTADPDTGYHFVAWSDGSTDNPRTDTNVTADVAVTASFAIDTFTLDYAAGTGGSLTGETAQVVNYGADGTPVEAVPDTNYHFVAWSDGSTDNPRTDTNVIADVAVTANFAIDTFTLDYAAGTGGSLTGDTAQVVNYGEDGTPVEAVPDTNYHFVAWSDGSTDNPRTDTNVTAGVAVTANFAIDTFTLDYAAGAGGSLTGDTSQTVDYGTDGTPVTAAANTGYHFVAWSDGSTDNPRTDTNVTADVAVTANFAQDEYSLHVAVDPEEGGSVEVDPEQTTYHYGETVTLTATAASGWTFTGWSGDLISVTNLVAFTMNADKAITATFSRIVETCVPITHVSLRQTTPDDLYPDDVFTFSAALLPLNLTTPYSYTINGGATLTGSANPLEFTLTYTEAGTTVALAVWNCAQMEPVTDTVKVTCQPTETSSVIYLPLIMRNATP